MLIFVRIHNFELMKTRLMALCMIGTAAFGQKNNYPTTKQQIVKDNYFETTVEDPYRWLEDDKSTETMEWVKAQNKVTYNYLDQIKYRSTIQKRMQELWNYERISAPFTEGKYTYFYKNDGLQNQSVLYRKTADGNEELFLDPNTFSKDGSTSLGEVSFSKDGSKVAYSISEGGSDWRKVIVLDALTKKQIGATLIDIKFSGISWRGNEGFYYSSYDKPTGSELSALTDQHKLYYHKIGTEQKEDKVIFGADLKRRYVGGSVTDDDRFLVITAANATSGNELYLMDLTQTNPKLITLSDQMDSDCYIIENEGEKLFIVTNFEAPNQRVVTVDASAPQRKNWKTFISETKEVLSVSTGGGFFFAQYIKDAISVVKQYDYSGKLIRDISLPGVGTASGFGGKRKETVLYYSFTNYTTPGSTYSFDVQTGTSTLFRKPKVGFNSDGYVSKQVFYTSKDGTKIPMIITHKKGAVLNGKLPTILYGYGGFNVSLTPAFSISNAVWLEMGGVYAVANLRGGGEYGKSWHDAGTKMNKQNVFDDFIAAAEYLILNDYTSSDYLAIRGGSNGGLLVGATMTQRPELFRVALPAVGVLDMLRYNAFTAGAGWAYDYGTAQDSKEMFEYLKGYSPVHNVRKGVRYPATLITTGDHDDRVVPAHSFKFAAELQAKQGGELPTLIRIDINAGHGAGKSVAQTIAESSDVFAFTLFNMGFTELPKEKLKVVPVEPMKLNNTPMEKE